MSRRAGVYGVIATVMLTLAMYTSAAASTGDVIAPSDPNNPQANSGWQAGTCKADPPPPGQCSVDTAPLFFEQAAGHPPVGFTQFIVKHTTEALLEKPQVELKMVRVDLPVGLSVNPGAVKQCPLATFESSPALCAGSEVGESKVTAAPLGVPVEAPPVTVYNLVPKAGEPALFGFELLGNDVYLRSDVAWASDYHEGFTIDVPPAPSLGPPLNQGLILKNRLVFNGRSGDGTFITTPSTCLGPAVPPFQSVYSTWLLASSVEEEKAPGYQFPAGAQPPLESRIPPGTSPKECDTIPFAPAIAVDPKTAATDSPSGAQVEVDLPHQTKSAGLTQETSHLRTASVTLPAGMGLNPSAANGLQSCGDEQFGKGISNATNSCPAASKVGTVSIETPPLPEGPLTGAVYVGRQLSRDPASGNEYRIFVEAKSDRYGVVVRLIGNVSANPQTGQLTTTIAENPQVPFSSFRLAFNGGALAPLTSPPTCGPNGTTSAITPWSTAKGSIPVGQKGGPSGAPPAAPSSNFTLSVSPGGGGCAKTLGARPFAPSFGTNDSNPKGGAFAQFAMNVGRNDGNQELKGVDVTLPPGLTAKLAGVRYCPGSALAAAAANSGAAEAAHSSCPDSSLIGSASVTAGSGSNPYHTTGKVFLTGPYRGAPLSLAVITPATAGPFDLGSVVVRVALFVDPETARVHAVSDPIPHVFGGALLDVRSINVKLDRPKFSLNPTNCSAFATSGALRGGGSNPLDPAAFSSFAVSSPFKVNGCENLEFKPKLFMRIFGGTRRAKSPKLRAVLVAREGDANIGRAAVKLPKPLILEQASLANVCTRVQFAAHDCPKDSVYGFAEATTPLLDGPLKGPVYLRSSSHELPDMVAALNGQVDVVLDGRIDSVKGRLRTTFDTVPDVPVSKFVVTIKGGKKRGLLVNSSNLCAKKYKVIARFTGQNGKKRNMKPKLRTPCKKHKKHHKSKKKGAKH
ncbi:MAG TPA: hypothetical protein VKH20_04925 [Solirubrobacterales bacterium]|nr:hypothetical protein [Solirubrobacterales bacterium]